MVLILLLFTTDRSQRHDDMMYHLAINVLRSIESIEQRSQGSLGMGNAAAISAIQASQASYCACHELLHGENDFTMIGYLLVSST